MLLWYANVRCILQHGKVCLSLMQHTCINVLLHTRWGKMVQAPAYGECTHTPAHSHTTQPRLEKQRRPNSKRFTDTPFFWFLVAAASTAAPE
jgi:hypothetical protein